MPLSRNELVELVRRIIDEGPYVGKKCDEWITILQDNVPDPAVTDYIYWGDEELTPEQIVDRALSHKPILLPSKKTHTNKDEA